jgi:translation initiation factor 2B subunit (eIF-2B alpha/beta/delta family)
MNMPSSFNVPSTAKATDAAKPIVARTPSRIFGALVEKVDTDSTVATPSRSSYVLEFISDSRKREKIKNTEGIVSDNTRIVAALLDTSDVE